MFGQPTVLNNVVSLASVPVILAEGAANYKGHGSDRSRGTLTVQLAGNIRRGGLVEIPFGISLRQLLEDYGGGTATGRPIKAVQVGGPLGAYIPPEHFDTIIDYEAFKKIGAMLGHGGLCCKILRSGEIAVGQKVVVQAPGQNLDLFSQ